MTNRVSTFVLGLVTAVVLATGAPAYAFEPYDDFAGPSLGPDLWFGISTEGTRGAPTTASSRGLADGGLRLNLRSFGGTQTDSGTVLTRQGVNVVQLGPAGATGSIVGLEAKATVIAAKAQACAANPAASSARAQVIGGYFNDGTSTGGDDRTGDIIAILELRRSDDGSNSIVGSVNRCTEPTCASSTPVALSGNPAVLASTWALETPVTLRVVWQRENEAFLFVVNPGPAAEEVSVSYAGDLTETSAPVRDFKSVRILNVSENCTADRALARMDVVFDDVRVKRRQ
jgi:hypothetical protein